MGGSNEDDSVLDHDQRSFCSNKPSRVKVHAGRDPHRRYYPLFPLPCHLPTHPTTTARRRRRRTTTTAIARLHPPSEAIIDDTASLVTLSSQAHEEERRWKQEKLVKLHRTDLALGLDFSQSSLPPPALSDAEPDDTRKVFCVLRWRSSSFADYTKPLTAEEDHPHDRKGGGLVVLIRQLRAITLYSC